MGQVTAMGCAGAALIAACLAVEADPWLATVGRIAGVCGRGRMRGGARAGPGSFAVEIIDALYELDRETLARAGEGGVMAVDFASTPWSIPTATAAAISPSSRAWSRRAAPRWCSLRDKHSDTRGDGRSARARSRRRWRRSACRC